LEEEEEEKAKETKEEKRNKCNENKRIMLDSDFEMRWEKHEGMPSISLFRFPPAP